MNKLFLLSFTLVMGTVAIAEAQTRFISVTGNDTANTCTDSLNPCATITHAVTEANIGDTVLVRTGTYAFTSVQTIDKKVVVMGEDTLNKPVITVSDVSVISVEADSVTIENLRIEMGLTTNDGMLGIVANGNYNALKITNNEIISTKPFSFGLVFSSYGIYLAGGQSNSVEITNNYIAPLDSASDAFGRGVGFGTANIVGPGGLIAGNTVFAFYPVQTVGNTTNLTIDGNEFAGSLLLTYPGTGTQLTVTNNNMDGYNDQLADNLVALLEVRGVNNDASAWVENNTFANYRNIGMFSSASRNVTVKGNTFNPAPTATDFASLFINSKLFTNGVQNTTYANKVLVQSNTFNAGVDSNGVAITYGNHYSATSPAFEDSLIVGGPNFDDRNNFMVGHRYFIALDTLSGSTDSVSFWASYNASTMTPFNQNIYAYAAYNNYGITDTLALEAMMFDSLDFSGLGKVILFDSLIVTHLNPAQVNTFSLYPNPAVNSILVKNAKLSGTSQVAIYDLQGKLQFSTQVAITESGIVVPVEQLSNGTYIITVLNNGELFKSKFMKQ